MKKISSNVGLSLIELMISLTLGAFIIMGAIQAYLGSRQASSFATSLALIQESSRFIFDEINSGVRQAGDVVGCPATSVRFANEMLDDVNGDGIADDIMRLNFNSVIRKDTSLNDLWFTHFYRGIEAYTGTYANTNFLAGKDLVTTSDVLVVHKADASTLIGIQNHDPAAATMTTAGNHSFNKENNDFALAVSEDCRTASLFKVSDNSNNTIAHASGGTGYNNCSQDLGSSSASGSTTCSGAALLDFDGLSGGDSNLTKITTAAYFVRFKEDIYSLMRLNAGDIRAEEVAEGVERLILKFGIDTNNDGVANIYKNTATIISSEWNDVVTLRVALIMNTNSLILDNDESITCEGIASASDRNLRKCVTSTINIRNRGGYGI